MAQARMREAEFLGTERYELRRRLGSGGMGVVYQVYDRERGALVALKTLKSPDASSLYRFKQEFRGLADISHPNLATLHELETDGNRWFFTMELVDGVDFITHVRSTADGTPESDADTLEAPAVAALGSGSFAITTVATAPPDYDRLRGALRQLAEGVHTLHEAGKLHRDIKPSNVLVTPRGRVVVLDFGLIMELLPSEKVGVDELMVGTADYMAPEQAAARALSPASDWYAVGTVLFRALTGNRPFEGNGLEVVLAKQHRDPPAAHDLVADLPEDLDELCNDLLRRDPACRPSGTSVLERLGVRRSTRRPRTAPAADNLFVGRIAHLRALGESLAATRDGEPVVVFAHGRSGAGKSSLLRRFCDQTRHRHQALVLTGRCYERESVPYKGLDSLVDALCRYLIQRPDFEVDALLPDDAPALARLFPVLRRVDALSFAMMREPAERGPERGIDPHQVRRRAVTALRELLARLGAVQPLLLLIDDFQWGDVDSASLIAELVQPPDPPPVLLVLAYRSEEADASAAVQAMRAAARAPGFGADAREVAVGALSAGEAATLAMARLGRQDPETRAAAEHIARESGGNPFFIDALCRYRMAGGGTGGANLEHVVQARLSHLTEPARRVLDMVAVAARPLEQDLAVRAAGLEADGRLALAELRTANLVRTAGARGHDRIETYHDRIREIAVADLDAATLRERHRALASQLAAYGGDPESLAFHCAGAGEEARAADYAVLAGDKAAGLLAFERAARSYRMALTLRPGGRNERELRVKLGDALANAGMGAEAAAEYLAATGGASAVESLELKRRAAEQLLRAGHVDQGVDAIRSVLSAVGMRLASTRRRALASLLARRAQARLRGLRFRARDASQIAPEKLTRIDICWSVSIGIGLTDPIRGSDFQTRHLLAALAAGEPYRVARAVAMEASYSAVGGESSWSRTRRLIERATELAAGIDSPHARGLAVFAGGLAAYQRGRWRDGLRGFEDCATILRAECTGVGFEIAQSLRFGIDALCELGELREVCRRVPVQLRDAEARGDLWGATDMRTGLPNLVWLVADRPETARSECAGANERWSKFDVTLQHYYEGLAQTHVDLYVGDGAAAWTRVQSMWPDLVRSMLLRVQAVRIQSLFLRGRAALGACEGRDAAAARPLLRDAETQARALATEATPGAPGLAQLLRAEIARRRGDELAAIGLHADAQATFAAADMALLASCCRRRRAALIGGSEGDTERATADAWMRDQSIVSPEAMTRLWTAS